MGMAALNRLRAFTLLEVIIVMVISGIVLSIAMAAFMIMQRQFDNFRERGGDIFQVQRVRSLMAKDLANANLVQSAGASMTLRMPDGQEMAYHFRVGVLTREIMHREDTLATGVSLPDFAYVPDAGPYAPVNNIKFSITIKDKIFPLTFYKSYSAADLINLE